MVSEGTNITVLALVDLIWVGRAELSLVLLGVVEVLHSVVAADALVAVGAFLL